MGESGDNESTWLSGFAFKLLVSLLVFWILKKIMPGLRQRFFAVFLNYMSNNMDPKCLEFKRDFLSSIHSVTSQDPELRKEKAIKVLEVGVGTGTNFASYPDGTRLVVVDPNPHFKSYYEENRKKFPNIKSEQIIVTKGEEMDMVPSNSIDVVVVTWVFCSIDPKDAEKAIKQILRVLAPGGKFYFFEHVSEFDTEHHGTRKSIQNFMSYMGIWPFLFDGCCLDRDILASVQNAGFSKVEAQRCYNHMDHPVFQLINPTLKGVAVK